MATYILFLGFPTPPDKRDRVKLDEDRLYSGVNPQTRKWAPGEVRSLSDRTDAKGVVTFDAEATADQLVADFGPESDGLSHLPQKDRASFGFRRTTAAKFKDSRK